MEVKLIFQKQPPERAEPSGLYRADGEAGRNGHGVPNAERGDRTGRAGKDRQAKGQETKTEGEDQAEEGC